MALSGLIACREAKEKPEKEIMGEIQAIIRQICASVTFLPLLDGPCSFDLLVYADNKVTTPLAWEESDPKYIANSQVVRLRSFSTKVRVHRPARPNSSCVLTGLRSWPADPPSGHNGRLRGAGLVLSCSPRDAVGVSKAPPSYICCANV